MMPTKDITHRERLKACIAGEIIDRPPVALWRHFPVDDQNPQSLANSILHFQNTYDFDFVKVTPASSFCLKDWGVNDKWRGNTEGTRDYTKRVILSPEDWAQLPILDPFKGHLAEQLTCLKLITKALEPDTPVIQTVFNPLSQAKNLIGEENLYVHMRKYPDALVKGLEIITQSTIAFVRALNEIGNSGIFFAIQHAQYGLMSSEEYEQYGRQFDLQVLEANQGWFNVLHLHGRDVMFSKVADYPVQVINWHDRETSPSLGEGKTIFSGVVCGGLQRIDDLVLGNPEIIRGEAEEAIKATNGKQFILGTGCVVPITAPHSNLIAARNAVESQVLS